MSVAYSDRNKKLLEKSSVFMGYLPAGYPDRQKFISLLESCCKLGMDIAEVGFPAKDPFADGEVIRRAHKAIDYSVTADMDYWRAIRACCPNPLWVMGYLSDLTEGGVYRKLADEGVVDAFVIPGCDDDTFAKMRDELAPCKVDMVRLVSPRDDAEKLRKYFKYDTFIYYQLFNGPTGSNQATEDYTQMLSIAKEYDNLRVLAGFGVNTPMQVRQLLDGGFDGITIGTAMVKKLNISEKNLLDFVEEIANETRS